MFGVKRKCGSSEDCKIFGGWINGFWGVGGCWVVDGCWAGFGVADFGAGVVCGELRGDLRTTGFIDLPFLAVFSGSKTIEGEYGD